MKRKYLPLLIILYSQVLSAQIFDKYGINAGITYSTQIWNYKVVPMEDIKMDYKTGFSVFIAGEKQIAPWISIRPEFGYLQKGFKSNIRLIAENGEFYPQNNRNVVFHDLALDMNFKITPINTSWNPYLVLGLSEEYMFAYKDILFEEPGSGNTYHLYETMIEDFTDLNTTAILGLGLEVNSQIYIEFDYIPSLTKSFKSSFLEIKENCYQMRIGLNINKLLR
jgi:hypothetical protein